MAFVLVQHLAPDHKSLLSQLIGRYTRMQVLEVQDAMVVQANCVYIIAPNYDMSLRQGVLHLLEPAAPRAQLLAYVAHAFGKLAVADKLAMAQTEGALHKIFALLRAQTGHDFSQYKPSTICRRIEPTRLWLEVLETSALADMAQISQLIEDCSHIGVQFALDDFGTGYSSLIYLKSLRVAQLKIDQSFVRDMLEDPSDLAILKGVIGLAAAFKREVIAEGVETVAHGVALLQLGCEMAQGNVIAHTMPAEQLPAWAASWQPDAAWSA